MIVRLPRAIDFKRIEFVMKNRMPEDRRTSDSSADPTSHFMTRSSHATPLNIPDSLLTDSAEPEQLKIHDPDFLAAGETALEAYLQKAVDERTAELRRMITELEEVSYALVNDMRAPLRVVHSFAEILRKDAEPGRAEIKNYLERIISASNRIEKSIDHALTYHRTVFRVLPLQTVDLQRLVPEIIDARRTCLREAAGIRVETNLPVVLGNEALLTQCFSNLLDNAVKFVTPGTRPQVRIRAECTSECARIWIGDNGIGIARPAQKRLFGFFQKMNPEREGIGLGLAIVQKAVERMNGKLGVESDPGQGSRFWLEFRRVDQPAEVLTAGTGSNNYA